jgi:hypothetical protein
MRIVSYSIALRALRGSRYILIFALLLGWALNATAQTVVTESFDGTTFPPTGWTIALYKGTSTVNWARVTSGSYPTNTPHTGAAMAQYNCYSAPSGNEAIMVTPQFDLSARGTNTPTVSLWMYRHNAYSSYGWAPLKIWVNTRPDTVGGTLLGVIHPLYNQPPAVAATGWYQYTYNIPAAYNTGSNYIVFHATSDYYNNIQVDDVSYTTYGSPMAFSSLTTNQATTLAVPQGSTNAQILQIPVVVTGSTSPISVTSVTLNTTGSTAPTTDISTARVFYTGNSSTFATTTQFGSDVASPNGTYTVTGTQALLPGTNYFWVSYNIAAGAVVGHVVDGQCTSMMVAGSAQTPTVTSPTGSRAIAGPLNGTYTINPAGSGTTNFLSFNDAVTALQLLGVSGAVTFNVAAGTYNEQLTIPAIAGASATNTITFDGGAGNAATRILQYSTSASDTWVVKLIGADYFRFKNLTVNTVDATYGYAFWLTNTTTSYPGDPSDNNQIVNCNINCSTTTTTSNCIAILGSGTSYSTNANSCNNTLIQGNTIVGGYYAILLRGYSSTASQQATGTQILDNNVMDYYYYGIYPNYHAGIVIANNYVSDRGATSSYAIYAYYCDGNVQILKNKVWTSYFGIRVYYCNQSNSVRCKVINNMIAATKGTYSTKYPFYLYYTYKADVWNNSMAENGTSTNYGMYIYGSSSVTYAHDIRNNMVAYIGTSGTPYLVYNTVSSASLMFSAFDYNQFYSTIAGTPFYFNGTTYANLASMQAGVPAFNVNSVWGNPYYVATNDLHARSTAGFHTGVAIAEVTDDIDGEPRLVPPCRGADEFPTPPSEKDLKARSVMYSYSDSTWGRIASRETFVRMAIQNVGLETNPTSITAQYQINGGTPVVETFNSPVYNASNIAILTFTTPFNNMGTGNQTVTATINYSGDGDLTNNSTSFTQRFEQVKVYGMEPLDQFVAPGFGYSDPYPAANFTIYNAGGPATWKTTSGVGVGSTTALEYPGDVTPADDWIFTPVAVLPAGSSFRVRFYYKTASSSNPQSFEIHAGQAADPASMTMLVNGSFLNKTNTAFTETKIGVGTYPYFNTTTQTGYYIGIHIISQANRGSFYIDSLVLDVNPAPPPKIGFRYEQPATAPYIDDPATARIDLTAIYRNTGVINRRYQVTNTTNLYGSNGFMLWNVTSQANWIKVTMDAAKSTPQPNPYNPAWPRENQYFNLIVDPTTLLPGTYSSSITFLGTLFNDDFPVTGAGMDATNQPFVVPVNLTVIQNGTGGTGTPVSVTGTNLLAGTKTTLTDGLGNKIVTINVTAGTVASITVTEYPNQLPPSYTRMRWVRKYWTISGTGTGWTADVTFYYTDTEVIAGGVVNRDNLRGWRHVVPNPWVYAGTGSTSDPATNSVTILGLTPSTISGDFGVATRWNHTAKRGSNSMNPTFALDANYPNPFNPSTKIDFSIAEEGPVTLVVYNNMGAEVSRLVDEDMEAGNYTVSFDASNLPAGTYMYRLTSGTSVETRRMTLLK